jgi:hypothetical protein
MAISAYRAGYQPMKAPAVQIRSYGVAGKWSAEAVRARGVTTNAADLFLGPQQKGTDWAAAFATVSGSGQDAAMQDYVKRNVDKFSGGTLEAMLTATGLVDWYKAKMQADIAKAAEEVQKTLDSVDTASLMSDRTRDILREADSVIAGTKPKAAAAAAPTAATGGTVDVTV